MKIQTSRFGEMDVPEESFVTFPSGLVGFPQYSRYVIFEEEKDLGYEWLQSIDEPSLAFIVVQADLVNPDWEIQVPDDSANELDIHDEDSITALVIVTIPKGEPGQATVNLRGPIVVNLRNRKAKQVILHESLPLRVPLSSCEQSCSDPIDASLEVSRT